MNLPLSRSSGVHGSLFLFRINTRQAFEWVSENVQPHAQFFGNALVVEHRYAQDLVTGIVADGLAVFVMKLTNEQQIAFNEVRAAIVLRLKNGYCFTDEMLQDKSMFQLLNLLILQALWLAVRIFAINYAASEIKVRRLCAMTTPGM